jgi:hypothetical protein
VRAGSPQALVAVGETAARHSPAAFVAAVARLEPGLDFDAWSHHPYPPTAAGSPDSAAAWPNVGLRELGRFGRAVERAFGRDEVPMWVTEYGESTTAVPPARQAADLARAVELAGRLRNVEMLVWLMLNDHRGEPWQSGLVGKPSFHVFRNAAGSLDPRNARVEVDAGAATHVLRVPALELRWHIPASARVGVRYTLRAGGRRILAADAAAPIGRDGWVPFALRFRPRLGETYALTVRIEDVHGFEVRRTLELVGG